MILGYHTVTVLRATSTEDAYGNQTPSWATATPTTIGGCSVQPVQGDEQTVGRETVVSRWRLFAPPTADVQATDRVIHDADVYEVDGEVQRWDFPPMSHLTCLLRRGYSA